MLMRIPGSLCCDAVSECEWGGEGRGDLRHMRLVRRLLMVTELQFLL